jgi:hypothetical protein
MRGWIKWGLSILGMVIVMAVMFAAIEFALVEQPLQGQGNCGDGFIAKDGNAPFEYRGDQNVCKVIVKAGSQNQGDACYGFKFPPASQSDGCYNVRGLGSSSVTVGGGGTSDECKSISHVEFYSCPEPTDTDVPTSTPTSPPEDTATPTTPFTSTPTETEAPPTETPTPDPTPTETETEPPGTGTSTSTPNTSETPTPTEPNDTPTPPTGTSTWTPGPTVTPPSVTVTITTTSTVTPTGPKREKTGTPQVRLPDTGFAGSDSDDGGSGGWIGVVTLGIIMAYFAFSAWLRRRD